MRQTISVTEPNLAVSQSLIESAFAGDEDAVMRILSNEDADVNFIGISDLQVRHSHSIQHAEGPDELRIEYEQFKTDVTPLFAAAHTGHTNILKNLLAAGADVNQKLFRGYASTAAAREGHCDALEILLNAGAWQPACEEALLEACLFGEVKAAEVVMRRKMAGTEVYANAIVHASNRGLLKVVVSLIKGGVDLNSRHRILLRSAKPALYTSADCTSLFAAIVGRQAHVVKCLLDAGAKTDQKAKLGAWSWDSKTAEVLRVGAGMAEPYNEAWCAVEYWDGDGSILSLLLSQLSPESEHQGRTLLCHAVLCRNVGAAQKLIEVGANIEHRICTKDGYEFRPLHLCAQMGFSPILKLMVLHTGCELNARTSTGETALMLCALYGHQECFWELLLAGADLGLANSADENILSIAESGNHSSFVHDMLYDALVNGIRVYSSDYQVFSPIRFIASKGKTNLLQKLLLQAEKVEIDAQDKLGFSASMLASQEGHMETLRVLVIAGTNVGLKNKQGDTVISLAEKAGKREACEKILLEAVLTDKALHFAAANGETKVLAHLLKCNNTVPINCLDEEGCTPLMVSAREGHADACKLLLKAGADCYMINSKGETALTMARKNKSAKVAEGVILDYVARQFVLVGEQILKHTRQGKGSPHMKQVFISKAGLLSWGETNRRNVSCKEVMQGPSSKFMLNRRKSGDTENHPRVFRVVSVNGREIHFEAVSASHAQLWVRGIDLILKEIAKIQMDD